MRVVLEGVLSPVQCKELIVVAKTLAVVGYRPAVCSTTITEVATEMPECLIPLVSPSWLPPAPPPSRAPGRLPRSTNGFQTLLSSSLS